MRVLLALRMLQVKRQINKRIKLMQTNLKAMTSLETLMSGKVENSHQKEIKKVAHKLRMTLQMHLDKLKAKMRNQRNLIKSQR